MHVATFITKWARSTLTERSASQQHFLDLCALVGHPTPAAVDPAGEWFTFERGATKTLGGEGWADVWKRGFFAWEYKGKHKDLDAAYAQLLQYREDLESPPLLVTCDMERFVIRTNYTNTPTRKIEIRLEELNQPEKLDILRAVFHDPEKLKPGYTSEGITREAAQRIGEIAQALRDRGLEPQAVAHFLDRIVFCLFAEDVGLLPERLFTDLVTRSQREPERLARRLAMLFEAMAYGGDYGNDAIRHFNGNLFNDAAVIALTPGEVEAIARAALLDWSAVDPSIFGTLFERGLDPAKRSQLGAHYTSREDIETLVEPVVMAPLRREWDEVRATVDHLLATGSKVPTGKEKPLTRSQLAKARNEADALLHGFLQRLERVTVLDPACGSGNFLYVTLQRLKDLEKEVITYAMDQGFSAYLPLVGPWQLYGIELNRYAHELAQMTVWIGYLQWTRANGFTITDTPVLRRMHNIACRDAILDLADPDHPAEPDWPTVDFIVGNPPFLGDKLMRGELGDDYVDKLRGLYSGRIPGQSDLCCYWFEKARQQIADGKCKRAGLLATQGIRGGANREVLKRIKDSGDIFFAESDRPWILDGANVHVSMVGFDGGSEPIKVLDGAAVVTISSSLGADIDIAQAQRLKANGFIGFIGVAQKAPFDIEDSVARQWLLDVNPHGRPNSDVLRLVWNATDVTRRQRYNWNVDFGLDISLDLASLYEKPFQYVKQTVHPLRIEHREARQQKYWWLFARPCPDMREGLAGLDRYLVTPRVSKYRLFVWADSAILCDSAVVVFARSDDYFFGVLHSRVHEVWALKLGTRLETRPRYTPTTCFETFPLPRPTGEQEAAIVEAARGLNALREAWLHPPEWTREEVLTFPGSVDGPWARYVHEPDARGIGTVRYPRPAPRDADCAGKLARRTLTNLYNERPTWLALAHQRLDEAVFAAYGWDPAISDDALLAALLALNLERANG